MSETTNSAIPTAERILDMLEKIEKALPTVKQKVREGKLEKVEHEGMVVASALAKDIISISIKKNTILFSVL